MALHFVPEEFARRVAHAVAAMEARGLDALLLFRQESLYWLTGFDTFGFVFFQCLVLRADGRMTLLTRAPDLRQAQHTSTIRDIRIWVDGEAAQPEAELAALLTEQGLSGRRVGVEWDAYGLTALRGQRLAAALDGRVASTDASDLVARLRVVKSAAELAHLRRAAVLADAALAEARRLARPGAEEAEILAAMQGAVFRGDGDYPANEFIIGSGRDALLCRYFSGRRRLDASDQLTLEFAGVYRHYHACLMRTLRVGAAPPAQIEMHKAAEAALWASTRALQPGRPVGEAFAAHAETLDRAGYAAHRLNACGYSLGALFAPHWMDWPMLYRGNPVEAAPGMVFFLHMIIADSHRGLAMTLGHTVVIGETGSEVLSQADLAFQLG